MLPARARARQPLNASPGNQSRRQFERDWEAMPDWPSAAAKFGLAISAAMFGRAAIAAHARVLLDSVASAEACRLTAVNACGLANLLERTALSGAGIDECNH